MRFSAGCFCFGYASSLLSYVLGSKLHVEVELYLSGCKGSCKPHMFAVICCERRSVQSIKGLLIFLSCTRSPVRVLINPLLFLDQGVTKV